MATGRDLLTLAESRLGEQYVSGNPVPKDNPNWHGPWDCAELATWAVYQTAGRLYGCNDDAANPAFADAYSGWWEDDAVDGLLIATDRGTANASAGVILIRKPTLSRTGHVAITDGAGGTVEAAGVNVGVVRGVIEGRDWNYCVKIPELAYSVTGDPVEPQPLPFLLKLENPNMTGLIVRKVQRALKDLNYNPGVIDGAYGPHTVAAVVAFQSAKGLVADGVVGRSPRRSWAWSGPNDQQTGEAGA
jgi:hypothetical protein